MYTRREPVSVRIERVEDSNRRNILQAAYNFSHTNTNSTYSHYEEIVSGMECGSKIPFWRTFRMKGTECAIWPCKYYNA